MREAGAEFARMADTIESRLPAIGEALSKAPAHLKPLKDGLEEVARLAAGIGVDRLVDQLGEAGAASSALLKSMAAVQDSLDAVAGKAAGAASAYFDITAEAKKSARQVDELASRMDKFGDSLAKRNDQAEELHRRVKDAAENFTPPRADAGGMPHRNAAAAVGDESAKRVAELVEQMLRLGKTSKEIAEFMDMFRDMSIPVVGVQHQFAKLETAVQALSGPINQARADLGKMTPEGMAAWGKSAAEAIGDMARQAEAMPDISPVDASDLRRLQAALTTMDKMADKPDDMRKAMSRFRKQIEAVKNVGSAFNRELGQQIEHLSDETRRWYGLSFKDQREIAGWQAKHIRAAELNIQKGMNATYAYGAELWRAMKDTPVRALSGAVDELRKLTVGLTRDLTGVGEFTYTGLAKAFIAVGDDIKKDRQELMKLTADAGLLSSMFQAGMGAPEMTDEFDKLRQSMNNMLGRWGKTREESVASMRALTDAGFSMSSILGPTLKETEGGLWAFARAGEYAMTGLEELAKVSVVTGKDMGEVAAMAGQWREKLGVSISEVGETYLELESAARRSGLSVGKFMDRVMSSASGFVLFGGRVDEVADSLSSMMAGMRLPPGLAADIAGDFMQRLGDMTMEEATTAVAFAGKAGTDAMLKSAQAFKNQREKDVEQTKREMEKLDASGLQKTDADAYSKKRNELVANLEKAEEERNTYAVLLQKAAEGDKLAMGRLLQLEGQHGHASAARLKLNAAIKTMGVKEEDLLKKGATVEEGILAEMTKMEESGAGTWLMEQQAKEAGFKNWKEMKEIVRGQARMAKTRREWAKSLGMSSKEEQDAFDTMSETGDVEGLAKMFKEKASPDELLDKMQELRGKGLAISDSTIEDMGKAKEEYKKAISDFGDESDEAREAAERMAKTAAEAIAGVEKKKMPADARIAAEAEKQTPIQAKILESLDSLRKYIGGPLIGAIFAVKAAMDIAQLLGGEGLFGGLFGLLKGAATSAFSGISKLFMGTVTKIFPQFESVLAAASTKMSAFGEGLLSAGKSTTRFLSRWAGPLVAATETVFAYMDLSAKEQTARQNAYNRALKKGKKETEAKAIADRAEARATTRGDVGKAVGRVGGATAGTLLGGGIGFLIAGPIGAAVGAAIGGYLGGEGGAKLGEWIGNAFETEARAFDRAIEEVIDLGTLDDAKALVKKEEAERDALQCEKMDLIKKDARGEKLTSAERDRLRELQKELIEKEKRVALANSAEWVKEQEELQKKRLEGMKDVAKIRYEALQKKRELDLKKGRGEKLTDAEEQDLLEASKVAKMSDEDLGRYGATKGKRAAAADQQKKIRELEKQKETIQQLGGGTKADQDELARINKELTAAYAAASPLSVGGPAVAAPQAPVPGAQDMNAAASNIQAARDGEKAAAGAGAKTVTDNSTWNVHINSRSEKELQDAMLKTLVQHQQRLAN